MLRLARGQLDTGGPGDPALLSRAARRARQMFDIDLAARLARAAFDSGGGVEAGLVLGEAEFVSGHHEAAELVLAGPVSVSYTHLDVYKRQFLCCKSGIARLLEHGGGSVINTASFVAVLGAATSQISYSASKGGVLSMSRELGVQFARQGVRVNALCPGPVNTPLLRQLFASDPERAARRLVHVPMGRFGEPEEIAAAAAFLASDDSSFMTCLLYTSRCV